MTGIAMEELKSDELQERWLTALKDHYRDDENLVPTAVCLTILLRAVDWRGGARQLIEMLPHASQLDDEGMRGVLVKLGIKTQRVSVTEISLSDRLCPCVHISKDGKVRAVLGRVGGVNDQAPEKTDETTADSKVVSGAALGNGLIIADGRSPAYREYVETLPAGNFYAIEIMDRKAMKAGETADDWMHKRYLQFKSLLTETLGITFVINLLALVVPISIMTIYDQVIAKESHETLTYVITGVAIAFAFEIALRLLRARAQAYAGARLDNVLGAKVFEQIIHLPAAFTERAPVGGQISRIREFETFREFFSGALATVLLDLPFVVIFLGVIFWIAGPIVFVPIVLAFVYVALGFAMSGTLGQSIKESGKARSERYAFLSETTRWLRSIKEAGADASWENRLRDISADATWMNLRVSRAQAMVQNLSQTVVMVSGIATLSLGVGRVIDGAMSLGALIAVMILVWRVLQPIQMLFSLANRVNQVRQSLDQLRRLLNFDLEQQPGDAPSQDVIFSGEIEFDRVSMRYSPTSNPALLGVSLKIQAGELVAVAGSSGSGKSTVAGLAIGLLSPQAGTVSLDGIDIRQLRPITLRQTLAYMPQRNFAFPGTIYENIAIADPTAGMDRIREACAEAGFLRKIEALPDGFETRFREGVQAKIPQSFLQQMALARVLLREAPVIVMDEPASALDERDEAALLAAIERVRGKRTILMVTQRPSHMKVCDRLIILDEGRITLSGKPDEVLDELMKRPAA